MAVKNGYRLRVTILPDDAPPATKTSTQAIRDAMDAEDESASEEKVAQGRRDWEAFSSCINANRATAGTRRIYP